MDIYLETLQGLNPDDTSLNITWKCVLKNTPVYK